MSAPLHYVCIVKTETDLHVIRQHVCAPVQQRFSVRGSLKRARPEGHPVIRHQWRAALTTNSSFSVCRLLTPKGTPLGCSQELALTSTSLELELFPCSALCCAVFSYTAIVDAKVILHFCVECPSETAAVDCCVSCMPSLLQQELVTLVML